ncbi:MAG: cellulose binding domain-containing protein [Eubacterium sp.]|nr:cellulose binding domain-containing protein [Eubacterium sp.]
MRATKRIVSLVLCGALAVNTFAFSASADSYPKTENSRLYTYNGYTVEYKVVNEWTGNQNIEITVTNTESEILADWSMGYNAGGKINGLWNAQIYAVQETEYILKSAGYNSEIAPGQSVNFGYTLSGDSFKFPQNIFNCSKRVDITDNYDVYYNIVGDYGSTYQAEMVIENRSDTDYSSWQLSFDGNAVIDNLWNGKLIENNNGSFKVKNAEHNAVIYAGNSTRFNFSGTKPFNDFETSTTAEAQTSEPVTEITTDEVDEEPSEIDTEIKVDEESSETASEVTADQESSEPDSEITDEQTSETGKPDAEETEDTTSAEMTKDTAFGEATAEYPDTDVSANTQSDIIFGNYKLTAVVIPIEFGFEFDPELDSDEDGLPDYIEISLGLDRFNPDTDGDGLPDGYEYYYLGTDPSRVDSDDNGITDADEDFDEDGLTNIKEYNLSTNPFVKDSDYDGLSDYDEVYKYDTDPTDCDTDKDKVTDGDEIILGLDPNNPATFGYPDSEYTTEQTVETDSSALLGINGLEENPFTISVDITAAGVADHCLTADESGYSYPILQNDAVLGVVPELSYSDGLTVSDVIINFNIADSAVSDRIGVYSDDPNFDGINRFNIFKYFEEDNILLPVETFYDENENRVYTHVDRVGTYCLMDMEKWVNNIENTEPGSYYLKDEDANDPANIVFCIDTRSVIDDESFEEIKSSIKEITEDAFDRYANIKIYVYYQKFGSNFKVTNNLLSDLSTGENYFTGYDSAEKALDSLEKYLIKSNFWAYDYTAATQFMLDTCDENIIAMYHIVSDQRVMGSADKTKKLLGVLENDERVHISTICPFSDSEIDESSYAAAFAEKTKGMVCTQTYCKDFSAAEESDIIAPTTETVKYTVSALSSAVSENNYELPNQNINKQAYIAYMKKNLVGILGEGKSNSSYRIISSTGLTDIKLDTALRADQHYEMLGLEPTDTDKDGLNDWNEVNVELIKEVLNDRNDNSKQGNISTINNDNLLTLRECADYVDLSYVKASFTKIFLFNRLVDNVDNIRILPILSNPVDADSDNDSIPDYCDNNKLYPHNIPHDLKTDSGEKYVDTFEILQNLNSPISTGKKENCKVDVYALPNSNSDKIYKYNEDETKILVYSVVKSEDCYWLKVKINNISSKMGYVMWDEKYLYDTNHRIENIIEEFGMYHINLPFHIAYCVSKDGNELSHVKSPKVDEYYHIFKTKPEYQGLLMALANVAPVLNEYREIYDENRISNPIDGFTLIGMMFTESSGGVDDKNIIGSTQYVNENGGMCSVINAMIKCNLAFSKNDAIDLCNQDIFLINCIKLVNHLKVPLCWVQPNYDISNNFSSYAIAEANAVRWREDYNDYNNNKNFDESDLNYFYYSYYRYMYEDQRVIYFDERIIKDINKNKESNDNALTDFISKLHD